MARAKQGDTVKVHYVGTLDNGTVFDTSSGREPLEFTLGGGQVIPGFEEAVTGMQVGETKTTHIPADDAYGPHREGLVLELERERIPEDIELTVGSRLQLQQPGGEAVPVTVTALDSGTVTLDANHPLAGEDLTFELELVEIA